MIIHANLRFHNVAQLQPINGSITLRPQRVPEDIRLQLNAGAQERMLESDGMEIRYVCEDWGRPVRFTLSAPDPSNPARFIPYWGSLQAKETFRLQAAPQSYTLQPSERYRSTPRGKLERRGYFCPAVCRLVFEGGPVVFHSVASDSPLRPPAASELPTQTLLAYGTSITQRHSATGPHLTFASLLARQLGVDLLNLGSSGSCHCDAIMAEYLPTLDYHLACLCISVNMVRDFSVDAFASRAKKIVASVSQAHPSAPVVCLSVLPWYFEWEEDAHKSEAFRKALREICHRMSPNVLYVDGQEALPDLNGLTDDMLHPSDHGMLQIAHRLAQAFQSRLASSPSAHPSSKSFRSPS